jgi:hypothetical protein
MKQSLTWFTHEKKIKVSAVFMNNSGDEWLIVHEEEAM